MATAAGPILRRPSPCRGSAVLPRSPSHCDTAAAIPPTTAAAPAAAAPTAPVVASPPAPGAPTAADPPSGSPGATAGGADLRPAAIACNKGPTSEEGTRKRNEPWWAAHASSLTVSSTARLLGSTAWPATSPATTLETIDHGTSDGTSSRDQSDRATTRPASVVRRSNCTSPPGTSRGPEAAPPGTPDGRPTTPQRTTGPAGGAVREGRRDERRNDLMGFSAREAAQITDTRARCPPDACGQTTTLSILMPSTREFVNGSHAIASNSGHAPVQASLKIHPSGSDNGRAGRRCVAKPDWSPR